jgi:hypothetical protein
MPIRPPELTQLPTRPSWDQAGGKWYVVQTPARAGEVQKMYRHKPNLHVLCHPLSGSLSLARRLLIYCEALEVISVFREYNDLRILAVYRRYVTQRCGVPLDKDFFNLALSAQLSSVAWTELGDRMPDLSWIRDACYRRARFGPQKIAAE